MNNFLNAGGVAGLGLVFGPLLFVVIVWSLFWKGIALWHAGRRGEPWWFVAMLILNTVGILEIIYLFGVCKLKFEDLFKK